MISKRYLGMLAFLVTACGAPDYEAQEYDLKIMGGRDVTAQDFEAQSTVSLALAINSTTSSACTGTLIGEQWVLTAAHCFETGRTDQKITVYYGLKRGSKLSRSLGYKVHPQYNESNTTFRNDIALVKIEPAPIDAVPMPLPAKDSSYANNATLVLSGFGAISPTQSGEMKLRTVTHTYSGAYNAKELLVGATGSRKGSCFGDSGGPAYMMIGSAYHVVGVVSRGWDCEKIIYTDTRAYLDWIKSVKSEL